MKIAAIISKPSKPELHQIVPEVLQWFSEHKYHVLMDEETAEYSPKGEILSRNEIASKKSGVCAGPWWRWDSAFGRAFHCSCRYTDSCRQPWLIGIPNGSSIG